MIGESCLCILFVLLIGAICTVRAQPVLVEDFEGDLSNWTVVEGQMEISDRQTLAGNGALWMHLPNLDDANHVLEHNSFHENFGRYTYHFFTDGEASDADLYFMYVNENQYYKISCKPAGTDNPELILCKGTDNGEVVIEALEPNFDQSKWFKVTVERWCDGHTHVYIDDEQLISIDDYAHFDKGTIRLRGWAENTYIDEVYFEPHQASHYVENMSLCPGDSVWLGGVYRHQDGIYLDTISDESANCLIVREVNLSVTPQDTINEHRVICQGDSILLGDQWASSPGRILFEDERNGCQMMIDMEISVIQSSIFRDSIAFCPADGPVSYRGDFADDPFGMARTDTLAFTEAGDYEFMVRDTIGCPHTLMLTVLDNCATPLYIPNAFSPNGDHINDLFEIAPLEPTASVHMTIFDRWGGMIYSAPSPFWDGYVDGQVAMAGVYLYMIDFNGRVYSGSVSVLR